MSWGFYLLDPEQDAPRLRLIAEIAAGEVDEVVAISERGKPWPRRRAPAPTCPAPLYRCGSTMPSSVELS